MKFPIAAEKLPQQDVVRLDGVTVRYRVPIERYVSLKEYILKWRPRPHRDHLALNGIDLSVGLGEVIGIIGRNGAGKTTLLNVIARVLHPSEGRLRIRGRVAALIDLASAFHPELSGRENAFLNGALHGASRKDIAARFDSIAAFADIGSFIDSPIRTYSAGMVARLAFAIATSGDADILVIDEALGVGDAGFQEKCAARMDEYRQRGVTFIVVSHDLMRLSAMSDRVLWLEQGQTRALGDPREVIAQYLSGQHG